MMNMTRRAITFAGSCAAALTLSAQSTAFAQDAMDLGTQISLSDQPQLQTLVSNSPTQFAGIVVDQAHGSATVYAVADSLDDARKKLSELAGTAPGKSANSSKKEKLSLKLKPVKRSWSKLSATMQSITSDKAWIEQGGVGLREWYIDPENNCVALGVSQATSSLMSNAANRFGQDICIYEQPNAPELEYSRQDDTEPYAGGATIKPVPSGSNCTAGFAIMKLDGSEPWQLLTAGHCFSLNAEVMTPQKHDVGKVVYQEVSNNGVDIARIGGFDYYWGIYVGGVNSSSLTGKMTGTWDAVRGNLVNFSGGASGESDGWTVQAANMCLQFPDGHTLCYLGKATHTQASTMGGDSGGPWFVWVNGQPKAVGTHVGSNPTAHAAYFQMIWRIVPSGWGIAILQ